MKHCSWGQTRLGAEHAQHAHRAARRGQLGAAVERALGARRPRSRRRRAPRAASPRAAHPARSGAGSAPRATPRPRPWPGPTPPPSGRWHRRRPRTPAGRVPRRPVGTCARPPRSVPPGRRRSARARRAARPATGPGARNHSLMPPSAMTPSAVVLVVAHRLYRPSRHRSHSPHPKMASIATARPSSVVPGELVAEDELAAELDVAEVRRADAGRRDRDELAGAIRFVDVDHRDTGRSGSDRAHRRTPWISRRRSRRGRGRGCVASTRAG